MLLGKRIITNKEYGVREGKTRAFTETTSLYITTEPSTHQCAGAVELYFIVGDIAVELYFIVGDIAVELYFNSW